MNARLMYLNQKLITFINNYNQNNTKKNNPQCTYWRKGKIIP